MCELAIVTGSFRWGIPFLYFLHEQTAAEYDGGAEPGAIAACEIAQGERPEGEIGAVRHAAMLFALPMVLLAA